MFLITFFSVISTIIVICIATPIFMIVMIPLGFIYVLVQVSHLGTVLGGGFIVRYFSRSVSTWPRLGS